MVPTPQYAGERVVVMGLGKSGLSAAASLRAGGAKVEVWDDKAGSLAEGEAKGFTVFDNDLKGARVVVWSPGIPHSFPKPNPLAVKARNENVPLVCDVDLLLEAQSQATVIAITGTNGKSTTTSLTAHMFQHAGRKAAVGGNLGIPALELEPLGLGGVYVLELSSYQLELVPHLACQTAVLLNITPDHLDRHGGMDGYIAAKRRIFDHQRPPRTAIIGVDDPPSAALYETLRTDGLHCAVPISVKGAVAGGVYVIGGLLIDDTESGAAEILDLRKLPRLPGAHNWQNAAAAAAAALSQGLTVEAIVAGLETFPGLKHRQELVTTADGVAFVNDSKATNAEATEKALLCYENIYWIAGGQAKAGGIAPLAPLFPRIRHAFLIGEAAEAFAATLQGRVPFTPCKTLEGATAVAGEIALAEALPGATVLLSPACASWDMFKSFEHRGEVFRDTVLQLWPAPQHGVSQ
jgi:UDP-N-acetylmuramoylalanine--D-glutamate ligase